MTEQVWHDPGTVMWVIGAAGSFIVVLFGILHAVQNGRLGRVEDEKQDTAMCDALCGDIKDLKDCIQGKEGLKEMVARMDERVHFLWERNGGSGG